MTFDTLERSRWSGRPVALLTLTRGGQVARYTDADREITVGGNTYAPLAIERSEISETAERAKGVLQVSLPVDAAVVSWWKPFPRSARVGVRWATFHYGDTEVATEWIGRVITPSFTDTKMILRCEQSRTDARVRGANLCWMIGCPLAVYSQGRGMCNLDPADFAVPATVSSIDGAAVVAAAFAGSAFNLAGGYVEFTAADGELESRSIVTHTGTGIQINYGTAELAAADDVVAYPGCPGDWEACDARGNSDNYGGNPNQPSKNPYSGNPR